jgi:siroheme synthase (precorrin-2 oxidase/ferrochelatase)
MPSELPLSNLAAGLVAVIGSGASAMSSLQTLRAAGANVRWYCSDLDIAEAVLLASGPPGRLELSFADPLQADYRDFTAVVAGAGSSLDRAIAARARSYDVPVNVAGQPALSTFALPTADGWFAGRRCAAPAQEIAA